MADRVVDLEWRYSGSAITKNYLMMFDLLAHNNWERPVYYVATTGREVYIGLEDYLQMEGFAYRLVPVKQETQKNEIGGVNTAVMFDNLMNKFEFNISKPGFLISEDIFRMTITMRNSYTRLVEALISENKIDMALQVCDRIQQLTPDKVVPYNYFNLGIAEAYLKGGEVDKGVEILQRLIEIQDEQLAYFFSFPEDKKGYISNDIQQAMAVLHAVGQSAESNGQKEIATQAQENLDLYYNLYIGQSYNP
jgi:tetratricopeptide (TPR) repeat protein